MSSLASGIGKKVKCNYYTCRVYVCVRPCCESVIPGVRRRRRPSVFLLACLALSLSGSRCLGDMRSDKHTAKVLHAVWLLDSGVVVVVSQVS